MKFTRGFSINKIWSKGLKNKNNLNAGLTCSEKKMTLSIVFVLKNNASR